MANATKYVDNVNGNNGNTGNSEAQAYADIPTAVAAISGGGNKIYVQAGSNYVLTATIAIALSGDTTNGRNVIEGYTTTPGAMDGRPVITSATNSVSLFTFDDAGGNYTEFRHLKLTHTAGTRGHAITSTGEGTTTVVVVNDCVIDGCLRAINGGSGTMTRVALLGCEVANCTDTSAAILLSSPQTLEMVGCDVHDNAGAGVRNENGYGPTLPARIRRCVFDTNALGVYDVDTFGAAWSFDGCVFVDNAGSGFKADAKGSGSLYLSTVNNVFYGNGGYGVESNETQAETDAYLVSRNNAYGSNTSGSKTGVSAGVGDIALSADPFVSRAGRNFAPNSTAGGGAALRAAGFPVAFSTTTTNSLDVGAVQHAEAAAGPVGFVYGARSIGTY